MIRGAIFGCDGTLLDTMPLRQEATARYPFGLGIEVDKALGAKFFEMTMPEPTQVIHGEFNPDSTVEKIIMGIYEIVARKYHDKVGLEPGAREFIKALVRHGIPLTVASSGSGALIRPALARLGLEQSSMKILASSEAGLHKCQPDMFLTVARFTGIRPEDIWASEDALYAVRIVKAAGLHLVAI